MSPEWVVDASVAIKLFVTEDLSDEAGRFFEGLTGEPPARFYVPDLFYLECANILWKYVRRFGYSAEQARESIQALDHLSLRPIASVLYLRETLDLAVAREVSVYDASYAALANHLSTPLITADERLVRKLAGSGVEARWLGEAGLF